MTSLSYVKEENKLTNYKLGTSFHNTCSWKKDFYLDFIKTLWINNKIGITGKIDWHFTGKSPNCLKMQKVMYYHDIKVKYKLKTQWDVN